MQKKRREEKLEEERKLKSGFLLTFHCHAFILLCRCLSAPAILSERFAPVELKIGNGSALRERFPFAADRNLFATDIKFMSIRKFGGKVNGVVDNATLVSEIEKLRSIIRDTCSTFGNSLSCVRRTGLFE